jgi:hypothetical protein
LFPVCATIPAHLNDLLIIVIIFGEEYNLWTSSLRYFLQALYMKWDTCLLVSHAVSGKINHKRPSQNSTPCVHFRTCVFNREQYLSEETRRWPTYLFNYIKICPCT